ncbi:MAG: hypothetical protein ACR652_01345 [Methylocystis sp.]|uniref:hypothetical protein n=1 Tax=Methylocystis sp. TaxID=1911079 RepID=UPI003DA55D8B
MGEENTVFTKAEYLAARARFLKRMAARQAAEALIAKIMAGAPRESFGAFAISFEDIEREQWIVMDSQSRPASGAERERNF